MPDTRRRWIVRRAVMALVLLAAYVGSYGTSQWLHGRFGLSRVPRLLQRTVYFPLRGYEQSTLPGASTFETLSLWCFRNGRGNGNSSWQEVEAYVRENRRER